MAKTLKQFIVENAPEQVTEEWVEGVVQAHKIDPETWESNIPPYNPRLRKSTEPTRMTESEKPFVAVKLDKEGGTSYTVVKSTHGSFKPGDKLSDSDYEDLESAHNDGDVHLENLSKKGSGPSSKPGYFGRKSFRT